MPTRSQSVNLQYKPRCISVVRRLILGSAAAGLENGLTPPLRLANHEAACRF